MHGVYRRRYCLPEMRHSTHRTPQTVPNSSPNWMVPRTVMRLLN